MTAKAGSSGVLNVQADGVAGVAGWNVRNGVADVDLDQERETYDATTRANNGHKTYVPGLKDAKASVNFPWDSADPLYVELQAAYAAGSALGIEIMDGPGGTAQGLQADWYITQFKRAEPIGGLMRGEATMVPAPTASPTWLATGPSA